jgi:hypothetical protein
MKIETPTKQAEKPEILIRTHLGLGDALVCNAVVHHYAETHTVTFLCKPQNKISVAFMFRTNDNITVLDVENDAEADEVVKECKGAGKKVLGLGFYGTPPLPNPPQLGWDKHMYVQAGMPFMDRWNKFRVARQESMELEAPKGRFIFLHDDESRGFKIRPETLPAKTKIVRPFKTDKNNIFEWWQHLEKAWEIHCVDSSFAILADSLPCRAAKRLVLHKYARPDGVEPQYLNTWEVLT